MSEDGLAVDIKRFGAALRIRSASHPAAEIRRKDLVPHLPPVVDPTLDRFAQAEIDGDTLEIELKSGDFHRVPLAALRDPRVSIVTDCRLMRSRPSGVEIDDDAAVVVRDGRIEWIGSSHDVRAVAPPGAYWLDGGGRLLTPGLIDCHAHPVFAGDRSGEFALRAAGKTYREIAGSGGGIVATMKATRAATMDELVEAAFQRCWRAGTAGATTMEAKSGYDLTVEGELRMLDAVLVVDGLAPVDLSPTLLGAHVVPPEWMDERERYIRAVCEQMVPMAARRGLATAVDVYCDEGAFSRDEAFEILRAGQSAGLHARGHIGQFADLRGAQLIAEIGGKSADHLETVSEEGIAALAAAGVVAVMLPGACVQLRQQPPPVAALRKAGVRLAVATDLNPGSFHGEKLPISMWLAATHYGMTVDECWLGVTSNAAAALGRDNIGEIEIGKTGDLVLWDTDEPASIPYCVGRNLAVAACRRGQFWVDSTAGIAPATQR